MNGSSNKCCSFQEIWKKIGLLELIVLARVNWLARLSKRKKIMEIDY